jgi:hypothetical protein
MTDTIRAAIDGLRSAFPPHPLDVRTAFDQWGKTYTDGASFEAGAQGKRWDELPAAFLEFHHDAPLFLGWPVIADVIPAYLATALRRDPQLNMLPAFLLASLTRGVDNNMTRFDAQFAQLSLAQRTAIARALAAWEQCFDTPDRRAPVKAALYSYWQPTEE